jgi:hypothetical protein
MSYKLSMVNKSDLPKGWAMPDYMAKRVSDSVNKRPESPEDKLQKALDEVARDIALIEPDPKDWAWWVSYLLDQLGEEAKRRRKLKDFKEMLKSLIFGYLGFFPDV